MRKNVAILATSFVFLGATPAGVARQDCWNLAYRYCCHTAPDWSIECPGVQGGVCEGLVHNNINEFKQTLIDPTTGAMTAASFDLIGPYYCEYFPPICHGGGAPHCTWELEVVYVQCSEWARKTQWTLCDYVEP